MTAFGYVSPDAPAGINIYVDSFEDKEAITDCIDDYNKTVAEEDQISYTDYVGLLMSSVTTIVNVISYVLIAFVAGIACRILYYDWNYYLYLCS